MQIILGVIFHFIGGFASGSFYIPFKKVKDWSWESYWLIAGVFSWLIVPPLAACVTIPNFTEIISQTSCSVLSMTYLFGVLWGIGGLTYGLGFRYLGISLGSSIILGLTAVFGAVIPSLYYDQYPKASKDTFTQLVHSSWGQIVLLGLLVCVFGIILCGKAGMRKNRGISKHGKSQNTEFKIGLGLFVAVISGVLSACFAFGIDAGKEMANVANAVWKTAHPGQGEFLYQNNVTYVVILWGGLTSNMAQVTAIGSALAIHAHWNTKPVSNDLIELKYYTINHNLMK